MQMNRSLRCNSVNDYKGGGENEEYSAGMSSFFQDIMCPNGNTEQPERNEIMEQTWSNGLPAALQNL